jgi:hypothetical protein
MENIQQHIDNLLNSKLGEAKESELTNFSSRKKVYQFDLNNNLLQVFNSIWDLKKEFGDIHMYVKNSWKYKDFYFSTNQDFNIETDGKVRMRNYTYKRKTTIGDKHWNNKPVQLIKDDVVMYEFDSQLEVAEFLGVHVQTVRGACNGKWKTCKGYIVKKK